MIEVRNEVILLGTIHSQHLASEEYSLVELQAIVESVAPNVVLAEIPPSRFEIAKREFDVAGKVADERIRQYPEYSELLIPLAKNGWFDLIPVSAWNEEMALGREKKLVEISEDPKRAEDWNTFLAARERTNDLFDLKGKGFDPFWVNSTEFDEILETELSMFNILFNDDLGSGGWQSINEAHYQLISDALDCYEGKGVRVLITFGAGHKGWLRKKLAERDDIELLNLIDVL